MIFKDLIMYKIAMSQMFNKQGHLITVTFLKSNLYLNKYAYYFNYKNIQKNFNCMKKTKSLQDHFYNKYISISQPKLNLTMFNITEKIHICSKTVGKGFASNIKCHKTHTGPKSHGSKHIKLQGSLGSGTTPGRVIPGKKMSKHLGNVKRTIKNLSIFYLNSLYNLLIIKGSIPGKIGNFVLIKKRICNY